MRPITKTLRIEFKIPMPFWQALSNYSSEKTIRHLIKIGADERLQTHLRESERLASLLSLFKSEKSKKTKRRANLWKNPAQKRSRK